MILSSCNSIYPIKLLKAYPAVRKTIKIYNKFVCRTFQQSLYEMQNSFKGMNQWNSYKYTVNIISQSIGQSLSKAKNEWAIN